MMKKSISLKQVSQWLHSPIENKKLTFGACVDSRLLKTGDLFFACAGERSDGHEYLKGIAMKGAAGAVVRKNYIPPSDLALPLIHVEDPLKALQKLAATLLACHSPKIVAITGSMGKTTTKEFLSQFLSSTFLVGSTPGNANSQLGLPLSILNELNGQEEILVLEMGMTHAGNIQALVEIAPPEIAVVTAVAHAHFENFDSLEEIAKAKAEILCHTKTRLGIIDQAACQFKAFTSGSHCPLQTFSLNDSCANYALVHAGKGFSLINNGKECAYFSNIPFPGKHNLHNFLAAVSAAVACGVSSEALQEISKSLKLPSFRFQIEEREGALFVHDSYNALPVAVMAALDNLPAPKAGGRKIAVLSEMRELGTLSEYFHREIGEYALKKVDVLFCMGQGCAPLIDVWHQAGRNPVWAVSLDEIALLLKEVVRPGDVVLVKGSRSSGFSSL